MKRGSDKERQIPVLRHFAAARRTVSSSFYLALFIQTFPKLLIINLAYIFVFSRFRKVCITRVIFLIDL